MSDILDLIDDVITWHGSQDAMCWTTADDRGEQVIEWVRANTDHTLTPWQERIILQTYSPSDALRPDRRRPVDMWTLTRGRAR